MSFLLRPQNWLSALIAVSTISLMVFLEHRTIVLAQSPVKITGVTIEEVGELSSGITRVYRMIDSTQNTVCYITETKGYLYTAPIDCPR